MNQRSRGPGRLIIGEAHSDSPERCWRCSRTRVTRPAAGTATCASQVLLDCGLEFYSFNNFSTHCELVGYLRCSYYRYLLKLLGSSPKQLSRAFQPRSYKRNVQKADNQLVNVQRSTSTIRSRNAYTCEAAATGDV